MKAIAFVVLTILLFFTPYSFSHDTEVNGQYIIVQTKTTTVGGEIHLPMLADVINGHNWRFVIVGDAGPRWVYNFFQSALKPKNTGSTKMPPMPPVIDPELEKQILREFEEAQIKRNN